MPKKTVKKTTKKNVKRNTKKAAKKMVVKKASTKKTTKRTKPVVAPQVVQQAPQVVVPMPAPVMQPPARHVVPMSDLIWNEIQNMPIQLFGLPGQIIAMHCTPVNIEPSKLYVSVRSAATLPALETALADRFVVEMVDKWVAIMPKPQPLGQARR